MDRYRTQVIRQTKSSINYFDSYFARKKDAYSKGNKAGDMQKNICND